MPNDFQAVVRGSRVDAAGRRPAVRRHHAETVLRRPRHVRSWRPLVVVRTVAMSLVAVLVLSGTAGATAYLNLLSKIEVQDLTGLVLGQEEQEPADPSDPFSNRALNILVMGTDLRDEANAELAGEAAGMRSDTTMLVHISADRRWIEIVSIPRDSMVDLPECRLPDESLSEPRDYTMFNEAFSIGGGSEEDLAHAAACTITAVHDLTDLTITNHAVVKMDGVIDVVNAIGGVRMCFPEPIVESRQYGSLSLPEGEHTLSGYEAIQFLRARQGTGMGLEAGSDLTRIKRQQAFLSATMRQILSAQTLADPTKTYGLADAVLSSLSADPDLANPNAMVGLAWSLRNIDAADIVMTELPVVADPRNDNRVVWQTAAADEIWERLAADTPPAGHEAAEPTASASLDASGEGAVGTTAEPGSGGEATTGATDGGGETTPESPATSPSPDVLLEGVCAS